MFEVKKPQQKTVPVIRIASASELRLYEEQRLAKLIDGKQQTAK